jgi:metal-responsive CopG/Arc/MetJ family transcriptional regulator
MMVKKIMMGKKYYPTIPDNLVEDFEKIVQKYYDGPTEAMRDAVRRLVIYYKKENLLKK